MKGFNKLLVIGPGSLVGSRFVEIGHGEVSMWGAGGSIDGVLGLESFENLDITDESLCLKVIKDSPADYVINFAGAALVDEIEKNKPSFLDEASLKENIAYKVNVLGVRYVISACKKTGKFPIFISTDFVFDGKTGPYKESDPVADNPQDVGFYAWTKILAEKEILNSGISCLIIRIAYPYRKNYTKKTDFARTILKVYDELKNGLRQDVYPMFSDQTLTPTFTDDLFPALKLLVSQKQTGIFHLASLKITTPYDFAYELLKTARNVNHPEALLKKGSIIEFQKNHPELAKRPVQGGLRSDNIARLGFQPTDWKEGIKKAFKY